MNFAGIIDDDIVDCDEGFCVSLWFQGCDKHCKGCHNPHLWDHNNGKAIDNDKIVEKLLNSLHKNGINRQLSILGGEPLDPLNRKDCAYIVNKIHEKSPSTQIYCWTGYTIEELHALNDISINSILSIIDVLVDGPYIEELRDTRLKMRGSSNQRILYRPF